MILTALGRTHLSDYAKTFKWASKLAWGFSAPLPSVTFVTCSSSSNDHFASTISVSALYYFRARRSNSNRYNISLAKMAEVDTRPDLDVELPEVTQQQALVTTNNEVAPPAEKKVKKIIRRKKRPARPQVDPALVKSEQPVQTGTVFNIWYNKWSGGDREDKYLSQTKAKGRCNIALDSGYTRADSIPGSYFCLHFARGICHQGQDCERLHRLPTIHDWFNPSVDCFGRDKFSDYRDDMGGVGSFSRQNRTIYVGRIHVSDDIEEIVARHFAEWGQVERIRVLNTRGVAFITVCHSFPVSM